MSAGHYEQRYPNSCVPACMGMIQIWRGEPATEDAFHDGAEPGGHALGLVCKLPRTSVLPAMGQGDEGDIHLALRQGRRVVVMVSGPPYVHWRKEHYPSMTSKHGALCSPGSHGAPFHALLLIARLDDGYALYDPWFPVDKQPFQMSEDAFQSCFAGKAIVALP